MEFAERQQIARTILEQLAGSQRKLIAYIGARNFVVLESGVSFHFMTNDSGINTLNIVLNGTDTYDLEFGTLTGILDPDLDDDDFDIDALVPVEYQARKTFEGVHAEQLREIFTETTGLRLRIF